MILGKEKKKIGGMFDGFLYLGGRLCLGKYWSKANVWRKGVVVTLMDCMQGTFEKRGVLRPENGAWSDTVFQWIQNMEK